jgi:hypothetical protein
MCYQTSLERFLLLPPRKAKTPPFPAGFVLHGRYDAAFYSLTSILPFMAGCRPQM